MNRVNQSKAMKIGLIGLGVAVSTLANAQNRMAYNGPRANVNVISKSPDGDFSFCDNDPQAKLTKETYAACVKAIAGAKQMAEMCARANGEFDGFRRGFSWGLHNALEFSKRDPNPVNQGRQSIMVDQGIDGYIRQKAAEVNSNTYNEGSSRGASEAINRFTQFVDSGASRAGGLPSRALPNPIPVPGKAAPYANPYLSLMPGQFLPVEELIDREVFDSNQMAFVNRYDPMYWGGNRPQWTLRSLYAADGIYAPSPSMCGNPEQVFARWIGNDRMGKGVYGGYAPKGPSVAKDGTVPGAGPGRVNNGPRPGQPGQPAQPGQGPTKGDVAAGATPPQEPNYQDIYSRSFRAVYGRFSDYFYSAGFYDRLDYGQWYGNAVGLNVGGKFNYQVGRRDAFNEKFYQTEAAVYATNATNGYVAGFNATYDTYQRNPQPAFELVDVVGEVDDGIIQPNERIALAIRVKNYGGVGTSFPAQLAGNVSEVAGFTLQAPALSSQVVTSPIAARVASASGSNARVVLQVAGREIPINAYVTDQVTPAGITYDASIPSGIVKVTVTLVNNSRVKSYDVVKVNLVDTFNHSLSQNIGFLEAKQSVPVVFSITDYNPLDLIDGKVNLQAQSYLGNLNVGTQNVAVRSSNVNQDLARAFDTAIQNATLAKFLPAIKDRIYNETLNEATDARRAKYDNDPETMIANIVEVKQSHAQSATSQAAYSDFADQLEPIWKKMKKAALFGGKSVNQKYFLRKIEELRSN